MSDHLNLEDQLSNARALSNSVQFALTHHPNWPTVAAHGQSEIACNLIDHGLKRLTHVELDRVPTEQTARFLCGLATCLGEHIGRLLQPLPPALVQQALTDSIAAALQAMGADPARTAFNVTVSDPQQKEPLH